MSNKSRNLKLGLGAGLLAIVGTFGGLLLSRPDEEEINLPYSDSCRYETSEKPLNENKTVQPIATIPFREIPEVERPEPPREDELEFAPEHYLVGKVINSKGEAIKDVLLLPQEPFFLGGKREGLERILGYSDSKGEFKIPVPDVIQYDVKAKSGERIVFARNVNPDLPFEVVFEKGAYVRAKVVDENMLDVDAEVGMRMTYPFSGEISFKADKKERDYVFNEVEEGSYVVTAINGDRFASEGVTVFDENKEVVLVLRNGIQITGRIVDEESQNGISGANIKIVQSESQYEKKLQSDNNGAFVMDLPRGDYAVRISAEGYVPAEGVKLDSRQKEKIFPLKRGISLEGKVLDEAGGIPGARLLVVDSYGHPISKSPTRMAETDGTGKYGVIASPDSSFGLLVYHEDHVPQFVYPAEVDNNGIREINLKKKGFSLRGNVSTEGRASSENLPVALKPHPDWIPRFSPASAVFTYVTRTNPDGSFCFERLAPGKYDVTARTHEGDISDTVEVNENVEGVSLNLIPGFELQVTIQNDNGTAVPGTNILVYSPNRKYFGNSDDTGRANLHKVVPGEYSVLAQNPRTLQEERIKFTADREKPYLDIFFDKREPLVINVLDKESRKPIEHVEINYLVRKDKTFESRERKLTDRRGYFRLPDAGSGIKSVSIGAIGYSSERFSLDDGLYGPRTVLLEKK